MSGISMDDVFNRMSTIVGAEEKNLEAEMKKLEAKGDPTQQDLLKMQHLVNKYNMMTQLQSNTMKTISEAMKSVVGNIR